MGAGDSMSFAGPADSPDRYRLIDIASRGAEGELWRGHIEVDGQPLPVAVKILHPTSPEEFGEWSERWQRQAELLRSLEHPSLIKVREVFEGPAPHERGKADGSTRNLYLVMNWAPGETLPTWRANHPDYDPLEATRIVTRIAAAVDYLHSGKATGGVPVLHRDIKPANVIVDVADIRLVDFGFARLAGDRPTMAGTPSYLAPEVLAGAPPSEASDRFSLGAVAYFLYTGLDPAFNDLALMHSALTGVPGLQGRGDLADHLLAMMDRDPARRPSNVIEWAQSMAVGLVSERMPTRQADAVPADHSEESPSRHRWLVGAIIAIVVIGAGVAGALVTRSGGSKNAAAIVPTTSQSHRSTTTTSDSVSNGTTAVPNTVPDVTGESLAQATSKLQAIGATVTEADILDSTHPDGTVVSQTPAAGAAFSSQVTLQVARQPVGSFLADMTSVSGSASNGLQDISGKPYIHAVTISSLSYSCAAGPYQVQYNLSRNFEQLTATVGLSDDSNSSAQVDMQLSGDGRTLFDQTVGLGQAVPVKVDATGILRLTLSATLVNQNPSGPCYNWKAVFGDIEVFGTPSQVQNTSSTTSAP